MNFQECLYELLGKSNSVIHAESAPYDFLTRQEWQELVEKLMLLWTENEKGSKPLVVEPEISIFYHHPLREFELFLLAKISNNKLN